MGAVDLSGGLQSLFNESLKKAEKYYQNREWKKASAEYERCSRLLKQLSRYAITEDIGKERIERAKKYAELAKKLSTGTPPLKKVGEEEEEGEEEREIIEKVKEGDFSSLASSLIEKSSITWDDIGGLEKIKKTIHNSIVVTYSQKPEKVKIEGWNRILLFGPPGTGKTLLAAATSNELDATFFNVKVGSIESKWFGESPKILRSVFETAREKEPSVIFFDEVDSIACSRSQSESEGRRALLGTFLYELDGLKKERGEFVLTLTATNVPWDLDSGLISRCEKRIYVPLPDFETRGKILQIHLQKKGFEVNADMKHLAEKTNGYSGRDIRTLCLDAVNNMIEEINPDMWKPKTLEEIKKYKLRIRVLTEKDFENALSRIKPAATPEMIKKYEEWGEKFESTV